MKYLKKFNLKPITVLTLAVLITTSSLAGATPNTSGPLLTPEQALKRISFADSKEIDAYTLGTQTVFWGMQWVKMRAFLGLVTGPLPEGHQQALFDPMPHAYNIYGHGRAPLTHEIRMVEAPNVETPYSVAVVDLSQGPVVAVHPDHGDRYFRTAVNDIFGENKMISQKQDGAHPKPYLLAPQDWEGDVPDGMNVFRFRSRLALLGPHIARTTAANDMAQIHKLQDGYKLIALKDWGKSNRELPPLAKEKQIRSQIRPGTQTPMALMFFEMLGETLKDLTLYEQEQGFADQLKRIGITADGFDYASLDPATVKGLERAILDAQSVMAHKDSALSPRQPGGTWMLGDDITRLDDWLFRGTIGQAYVLGDLASEILYPMLRKDANDQPLSGDNQYTMHFPKGQDPAANYWAISMYDIDGFLIDNPVGRYNLGNMHHTLDRNKDGSLTIYIQEKSPGAEFENNWLPAPASKFRLHMRMYQPHKQMYNGNYIVPPLKKVEQ